jgi:hypothetical protein
MYFLCEESTYTTVLRTGASERIALSHRAGTRPDCVWWGSVCSCLFWRMWLLVGSGAGSSDNISHIPVWGVVRSLFPCGGKRTWDVCSWRRQHTVSCGFRVWILCSSPLHWIYGWGLPRESILGSANWWWEIWSTDSWFLESNGKMVQLGFSLIKNRAPHGLVFCSHRSIFFTSGHVYQLTSSVQIPGFCNPMVKWCNSYFLWSWWRDVFG